jgi:hypothetical protein
MKKFVVCAVVVACLLVAVPPVLQLIDAAQAEGRAQDFFAAEAEVEQPALAEPDVHNPFNATWKTDQNSDRRAEYLRLAQKHARLMSDQELNKAIHDLEQTVTQLQRQRELDAVTRMLQEIIDKHPDSEAAKRAAAAKRALEIDSETVQFFDAPDVEPPALQTVPDPSN